ncbi:MAG: ArsR family transcriptional regulator [Candidatus Geothermarchaeales archaeon]
MSRHPVARRRVITALSSGPKTWGELRDQTGISPASISKQLRQLINMGYVDVEVVRGRPPRSLYRLSPLGKAEAVAASLSDNEHIVSVILFGSVAKGRSDPNSDLDLLIVMDVALDLTQRIFDLEVKFDIEIETQVYTFDDFLSLLNHEYTLLHGILEGYKVLYDRAGIQGVLKLKEASLRERWLFDEETGIWLKKKLMPIWRVHSQT